MFHHLNCHFAEENTYFLSQTQKLQLLRRNRGGIGKPPSPTDRLAGEFSPVFLQESNRTRELLWIKPLNRQTFLRSQCKGHHFTSIHLGEPDLPCLSLHSSPASSETESSPTTVKISFQTYGQIFHIKTFISHLLFVLNPSLKPSLLCLFLQQVSPTWVFL